MLDQMNNIKQNIILIFNSFNNLECNRKIFFYKYIKTVKIIFLKGLRTTGVLTISQQRPVVTNDFDSG